MFWVDTWRDRGICRIIARPSTAILARGDISARRWHRAAGDFAYGFAGLAVDDKWMSYRFGPPDLTSKLNPDLPESR